VLREALSFGLGEGTASPNSFVIGAGFLLSSYLLGHFVFMAGAKLDPIYDLWRKRAKPTNRDIAFREAKDVQKKLTAGLVGENFNMLKWARAYVQVKAPTATVEIDRLEADSKFFRSLVVVGALAATHFFVREQSPVASVVALVMTGLSYLRFREQRWKMTELSCGTAVIVYATALSSEDPTPSSAAVRVMED